MAGEWEERWGGILGSPRACQGPMDQFLQPLDPAKLQAPESNRVTDRMKVSSVPTGLQSGGRFLVEVAR